MQLEAAPKLLSRNEHDFISAGCSRSVELSDIYPDLRLGKYELRVTLAPRRSSERATLAPFAVNIH
jgi:hypothetical protein